MTRIICDAVAPPMRVVGHDGGINIASGTREYHLVAISAPQTIERVTPPRSSLAHCAFVHDAVLAPLHLPDVEGVYPPVLIAGDHLHHPDYGPFTFEYHPWCPSDSIEITAYTGPKSDPAAIARDLVRTLESFAYVRHVRLAVLADKVDFCRALRREGFTMTAYLPAWHLQSGARYDCVLMTRRTTDEEPVDHGTRDLIDCFNQGFSGCLPLNND